MKHVFIILYCLLVATRLSAEDISPAVKTFVQEMLDTPDFRERWKAVSWEEHNILRNDPNGGYLFRFELKFERAKDSLLFVATDRNGDIRGGCPVWYVYRKQPGSDWKKIATTNEMISVAEFYIDHPARTIIQHFPDRFGEGMNFSTFKINADGSTEKKYYSSEKMDDALKSKLEKQGVRYVPEVEKVPFAAYLRSPDLKWRPLNPASELAGQSLDAGDATLLAASTNLTWKQAVELGKSLTNSPAAAPPHDLFPSGKTNLQSATTNVSPKPSLTPP